MAGNGKSNKESKYIGVHRVKNRSRYYWVAVCTLNGKPNRLGYYPYTNEGEKQAAKAYDLFRIRHGLEPMNVLKRAS